MRAVQLISKKLQEFPLGTPFTSKDLIGLGNEANIRKILERLVKQEKIMRVARGIYTRPKMNRYVGTIPPSLETVLETLTASTGEVFQVQGAEAAHQLGLSTQVPVKPIFLTNGRSRMFSIGNIGVQLRRVSPKKLILAGTPAGIAISALWYLTKEEISFRTIEKIEHVLSSEEFQKLLAVKASLPSWVTTLITNYQQQMKTENEKSSSKFS
jgi:hypothetical protein